MDLSSERSPAGDYHRRLFAVAGPIDEIAAHFGIDDPPAISLPTETIEGSQGLIVLEKDDRRPLKSMPWGLPRHSREMRLHGEPSGRIGLVADLTNSMSAAGEFKTDSFCNNRVIGSDPFKTRDVQNVSHL